MTESSGANSRRQDLAAALLLGWVLWAAQPAVGQEPIDGVCDDSVRNGCAAGTANDAAFPDQPNAYLWRCDGEHGGRNSDKCLKFIPVDGACDESVRNGCSAGRANAAAFPDSPTAYAWRCDGLDGGTNSEKCSKFVPVDGVCDDSVRNGCAAGTANDAAIADNPTMYLWRCDGQHGGANSEKCAIRVSRVPVDGVCDDTVRNGCAAGTANDAAIADNPTMYLWRCDGQHGGANSEKCGLRVSDAPVDGVCDETVRNGCAAGTANDAAIADNPTAYLWRCDGQRGGANSEKCIKFTEVDGGWSDWSACSATACGSGGTQTRTCNNPSPERGGQECLKLDGTRGSSETRACTGAAAVNGGWSDWSVCSASACGAAGTQTRTCDNPAPACGGSSCSGASSRACTGSNPVNGGWSDWSVCSASACGAAGTQTRTCDNPAPACGGSSCSGTSSRACTGNDLVNGGWSDWSVCSVSACGAAGTQTRTCDNPTPICGGRSCSGASSRACTGNDPVDGVWVTGAWGDWSVCSGSICNRSRSRTVACSPPACGGAACNESSRPAATETSACPSPAWTIGDWSEWSDCSATACGERGQRTRTRTVSCPCGTACPAPKPASSQTEDCVGDEPRDGVWDTSPWSPWSPCSSSTCKQSQTRDVTCVPPGCDGAPCDEDSKPPTKKTRACSNPPDPEWTIDPSWGPWSECSATVCGAPGHQIRTRTVTCPCGSTECPTSKPAERETQSCRGDTPVNGKCGTELNSCLTGSSSSTLSLSWRWYCTGGCGGSTASCGTPPPPPNCSSSSLEWGSGCSAAASTTNSGASVSLTNGASCRSGSATFTCNRGTWSSAASATCTVTPPTNGVCNNAVTNGCAAGALEDVADTTIVWQWNCLGECTGTDAQCSKTKLLSVSISASSTSRGRGTATATVSGGAPPYTYSWSATGAGVSIIGSSTGASINFSYQSSPASRVIDFTVVVGDSVSPLGRSTEYSWGTPPGG